MKDSITLTGALKVLQNAFKDVKVQRDEHDSVGKTGNFYGKVELIYKDGSLETARIIYETVKFEKDA